MSRRLVGWLAVLGLALGALPARAGDGEAPRARAFLDAVAAYRAGEYRAAAERFETVAAQGEPGGKLCYDLGNAWLKAGDLGRAVLWYERAARRLGPADPELRFNREYARAQLIDAPPEEGVEWSRVLLFWRDRVPRSALVAAAAVLNAALWLLAAAGRVWRRRALQRWAAACGAGLALVLLTLGADAWSARAAPGGVILPAEVAVRAATHPDATELFRLHAGSLVRVDRRQGQYLRIRYGRDALGWVPAAAVGLVEPDAGPAPEPGAT